MKHYTSIDQRNTAATYRTMLRYTMLNFFVLVLVFVLTYLAIYLSVDFGVDNSVKGILTENINILIEDGLVLDQDKYPSAITFIGYDANGDIITEDDDNIFLLTPIKFLLISHISILILPA